MKKYILGAVFSIGLLISPAFTQAAALTTVQANSLIAVVQSSPSTPAINFVNLITAFSGITVEQATSLIVVVQSSPSSSVSAFVDLLIAFTNDTTPAPTVTTNAFSPSTITAGQSAIIGFTSTNATSCTGSGLWNGNLGGTYTPAGGKSTGPINTPGTYTQSVTCTGAGGSVTSVTRTLTVTASTVALPTVTIDSFSPSTITVGQSAIIGFTSTNATACYGSGLWNGNLEGTYTPTGGRSTGPMNTPGTYTQSVTCTGQGGSVTSVTRTLTVTASTVLAPTVTIDSFSPSTITVGQSAIIGFTSTNATACYGSGLWNGDLGGTYTPTGGKSTGPINTPGTYTQSVTCTGAGGSVTSVTRTLTVIASTTLAPTVTIDSFSPSTITVGQSAIIGFTSTNATACYGSGLWNGDLGGTHTNAGGASTGPMNTPGTYTQSVTCTGAGGSATSVTRTLTVTGQTASAYGAFNSATNAGPSESLGAGDTNAFLYVWNNNLQIGSSYTKDVKALQTALAREGVYTGEISGGFYSQTFSAVKAFQQKYGIDTGTNGAGFVGSKTRAKLNTLY